MDESGIVEIDPPAAHRLQDIDVPTLVIKAELDPSFLRRAGDVVAAGIPGARELQIDAADHVVNLRRPAAFDDAVLPFLLEVRP
jgi:pimeloyl-ACP methyl ester carboxylesterase